MAPPLVEICHLPPGLAADPGSRIQNLTGVERHNVNLRCAGFHGGISHPSAVRRELPVIGVLDKEARFAVADERQDPEILSRVDEGSTHKEDEPAISRPVRGPDSWIGGLRRQQQLLATCPVGIHLVNAQLSLPRNVPNRIRLPSGDQTGLPCSVPGVCKAHADTTSQFVHPDATVRITCVE